MESYLRNQNNNNKNRGFLNAIGNFFNKKKKSKSPDKNNKRNNNELNNAITKIKDDNIKNNGLLSQHKKDILGPDLSFEDYEIVFNQSQFLVSMLNKIVSFNGNTISSMLNELIIQKEGNTRDDKYQLKKIHNK
jgi:hypothetical protein